MFRKAERKKSKLRLGIAGPSGSGKTWSSLEIATGIGGKIAVIDTESGRAELYAKDFEFDCMQMESPFNPEKYILSIKEAEKLGYDILIIDSLSHAWAGEGGILSIAERAGGSFTQGWKAASPKHNQLVEAIITSKLHIITTLRTKTEYIIEQNEKGKPTPRKVGLSPIQRDNLEYEFTIYMEMSYDNIANISKDNTRILGQTFSKPTKEMGVKLRQWLTDGVEEKIFTIEDAIKNIKLSKSLDELKLNFSECTKEFKGMEEELSYIIKAKNDTKLELEGIKND